MKKMVFLFVIIFSCVFLSSFALSDESKFYNTYWASITLSDNGNLKIDFIGLLEDHSARFLWSTISADNEKNDAQTEHYRVYNGSWSMNGDDLYISTKRITDHFYLLSDGSLAKDLGGNYYVSFYRFNIPSGNSADARETGSLETGIILQQGQYFIGEDLPAGSYRFEFVSFDSYLNYYEKADDSIYSKIVSLDKYTPVYTKLILDEGSRLDIVGGDVLIMYSKNPAI